MFLIFVRWVFGIVGGGGAVWSIVVIARGEWTYQGRRVSRDDTPFAFWRESLLALLLAGLMLYLGVFAPDEVLDAFLDKEPGMAPGVRE